MARGADCSSTGECGDFAEDGWEARRFRAKEYASSFSRCCASGWRRRLRELSCVLAEEGC